MCADMEHSGLESATLTWSSQQSSGVILGTCGFNRSLFFFFFDFGEGQASILTLEAEVEAWALSDL